MSEKKSDKKSEKNSEKQSENKSEKKQSEKFQPGDHVTWKTSQGETEGTVEQKLTEPTEIKSHHVAASPENPEYLVKSEKSGKEAAHKPESLKKAK